MRRFFPDLTSYWKNLFDFCFENNLNIWVFPFYNQTVTDASGMFTLTRSKLVRSALNFLDRNFGGDQSQLCCYEITKRRNLQVAQKRTAQVLNL